MHGRLPPMENFFAADVRCVDRKTGWDAWICDEWRRRNESADRWGLSVRSGL